MANGRIDVFFHEAGDTASEIENGTGQDGNGTTPAQNKNDVARSAVATMAINYAKQAAQYGLSIYGDMTGDYFNQSRIDGFISAGSTLVTMANFPVGTIAGAFSVATTTASQFINMEKQNKQTALYRERIGSETTNNSEVS